MNHRFANNIRILELKRIGPENDLRTVHQVENYMRWAQRVLNPQTTVTGIIVATGFSEDYINHVQNNQNINLVQYNFGEQGIFLTNVD